MTETARMWAGCTSGAQPVSDTLRRVGLAGRREGVRVKQLSGGERRLLDLALALIGRPEVLFLDEPTTGTAPEGRRETWDLIRQLRAEGTTVLLTRHYLEEAEELSDRLAIMRASRIVAAGTVAEVTAARLSRIRFTLPEGAVYALLPMSPIVEMPRGGWTGDLGTGESLRALTIAAAWTALGVWAIRPASSGSLGGRDVRDGGASAHRRRAASHGQDTDRTRTGRGQRA